MFEISLKILAQFRLSVDKGKVDLCEMSQLKEALSELENPDDALMDVCQMLAWELTHFDCSHGSVKARKALHCLVFVGTSLWNSRFLLIMGIFPALKYFLRYIQEIKSLSNIETTRQRPKSAPYLRLKNSKRTSKFQVFSSTVPISSTLFYSILHPREEKIEKNSRIFFDFFRFFGLR